LDDWDVAQRRAARFRFEACCRDLALSVMSDSLGMVPTGGELTLFEAVGPGRA
jgi:hypothetical protein